MPPTRAGVNPRSRYVLGGVIAAIGLLCGFGVLALNTLSLILSGPGLRDAFEQGQPVIVALDPADPPAIYAADSRSDAPVTCIARSVAGEPVPLAPPPRRYRETVGREQWTMLHVIEVPQAGEYELTCTGRATTYAIGDAARASAGMRLALGSLIGVCLIGAGVGVGGSIVLNTYQRQRRTLSELQRHR